MCPIASCSLPAKLALLWSNPLAKEASCFRADVLNGSSALDGSAGAPAAAIDTILPVTSQQKVGAPIEASGKNVDCWSDLRNESALR